MFLEESIKTKVIKEYDVAVCGGGFAGISAALAAARQGKSVVLFERQFMLGGLATAGLIVEYLPICDGYGRQVSFGIAEELLRLSIKHGAERGYPHNWFSEDGSRTEKDPRYETRFNAQLFAIMAEKLLKETGVDIIYGTYTVGVDMSGDKIAHLITENKSGRCAYKVKSVVDATGDCDIALFAGCDTETFEKKNVLASWYYSIGKKGYTLHMLSYKELREDDKSGQVVAEPLSDRLFTGLDGKEASEFMELTHEKIYEHFLENKEKDETYLPVTIPTIPQLRMTRKIVGEFALHDTEMHTYFEDSIGMVSDWRKRGPVYEVPFRTLYSNKVKNLICAGRCTSVTQEMWDIMRVIPCCAVTGEAAGVAAAMTDDFSTLDVKELQKILVQNGVVLHEKDL